MPRRRLTLLRLVRDENAQRTFFDAASFRRSVEVALDPNLVATRYNRTWRLSQPNIEREDGRDWLWAKLGFERRRASRQTHYSEELKDFVTEDGQADQGTFTHFVVDLSSQFLCVEIRPPDIRLTSFTGALEGILNQTRSDTRLTLELVPDIDRFDQWLQQVQRIDRVRFSLRSPNPSFDGRPEAVRQLLQESNSARVTLEANAPENESLDVQNSDLKVFADYTAEGYGDISATGQRNGRSTRFESSRNLVNANVNLVDGDSRSIARRIFEALKTLTP